MPLQNTTLPKDQCNGYVMLLWCKIPIVSLEYIIREETLPVNAQLHCGNYKWQLHVSATKYSTSGSLCEKYKRKFYTCSLHIVKND